MTTTSKDRPALDVELLNERGGGWNHAMGLRYVRASGDEVVAEIVVGPEHTQGYGIVHGGVHAGLIEATCSAGAALWALGEGRPVVGLENSTSFLRAVREGRLTCTAVPLTRGRRSQVWEARVTDDTGRLVSSGRVRLLCLEPSAEVQGEALSLGGKAPKA